MNNGEVLRNNQETLAAQCARVLICGAVFLAITMPCRQFFAISSVTEIRPATALPVAFGLLFGWTGAFGCATANFIADMLSGYGISVSLAGYLPQFLYGYIPYFLWYHYPFGKTHHATLLPRLATTDAVIKYIVIIAIDSILMAVMLGLLMRFFNINAFFSMTTMLLLLNNFDFCMILGMPILIMASMKKFSIHVPRKIFPLLDQQSHEDALGRRDRITFNEKLILIFLLLGAITAIFLGLVAWLESPKVAGADLIERWNRIYLFIAADLNIFYLITVLFLRHTEKNITTPIEELSDLAREYVSGETGSIDNNYFFAICGKYAGNNSEIGKLAYSFRKMASDLEVYIQNLTKATAEKERLSTELDLAKCIQASALPGVFPAFPDRTEFDIYATMNPAKEVGGDFYDFFLIDQNRLGFLIADVSDKGVPAALFMMRGKTLLKVLAESGLPPAEVFSLANNQLFENNESGMFITAWLGVLDIRTGRIQYVNAGHEPPLLISAVGATEFKKMTPGLILAVMKDIEYKQDEFFLGKDDILFLFTDGVSEAMNDREELFGTERMRTALCCSENSTVQIVLEKMKTAVDGFVQGAPQHDDITMVSVKYIGKQD